MKRTNLTETAFSKGEVEFVELPGALRQAALNCLYQNPEGVDAFLRLYGQKRSKKGNLVFNFPREQYAKLDRGETPEAINASWFTLSTAPYTNPAVETVSGEGLRVPINTKGAELSDPKTTIFRTLLDIGQFVGAWNTAILIGGEDATSTPGTGKIIAAVNNVRDDTNAPLNRDGTTVHLITWKLKHLDSSEV